MADTTPAKLVNNATAILVGLVSLCLLVGCVGPGTAMKHVAKSVAETAASPIPLRLASSYTPGWNAVDSTACLQAALRATDGSILVIDKQPGPWIVGPLVVRGSRTIVIPDGVEIVASDDPARWRWNSSLLTLRGASRVTIQGYGTAMLRMRGGEYSAYGSPYGHGPTDARHAISIGGCDGVWVGGLRLVDAGGDGIYVGGGSSPVSTNVAVENCVVEGYARCGIAAVSVRGLTIRDCEISDPVDLGNEIAAIDLEPNPGDHNLSGITIDRVDIYDCPRNGIIVALCRLGADDPPVSVAVRDCTVREIYGGTFPWAGGIRIKKLTSSDPANYQPMTAPPGVVSFERCTIAGVDAPGLVAHWYVDDSLQVRFMDCRWADVGRTVANPLYIKAKGLATGTENTNGGIRFKGCSLSDAAERAAPTIQRYGPGPAVNVVGGVQP